MSSRYLPVVLPSLLAVVSSVCETARLGLEVAAEAGEIEQRRGAAQRDGIRDRAQLVQRGGVEGLRDDRAAGLVVSPLPTVFCGTSPKPLPV